MTPAMTRPYLAVARGWSTRQLLGAGVAAGVLGIVAIAALVALRTPLKPLAIGRATQVTLDPGLELDPALSPDGKLIAYSVDSGLMVRQVDGSAPVLVARGRGRWPAWSPDARRLVFWEEDGIKAVPALGGAARVIVRAPVSPGLALSPRGDSLVFNRNDSLFATSADGGTPRFITTALALHSPAWSPDGRWIAFVSGNQQFVYQAVGNLAQSEIMIAPASGGAARALTDTRALNASPAWAPDGALLFVSSSEGGRDVFEVGIDRRGRTRGPPVRLTTGLAAHSIHVAADGSRLAYAAFTDRSNVWSLTLPASGTVSIRDATQVTFGNQTVENISVSPDGRWIAFDSDRGGLSQLYRQRIAGGEPEPLTHDTADVFWPSYSPDGRFIAFHAFRNGLRQIFVMPADGGPATQVTNGALDERAPMWSPDGHALVTGVSLFDEHAHFDVIARSATGWQAPHMIPVVVHGDTLPGNVGVFTSDGRGIACNCGPGGIVVAPLAGGEGRVLTPGRGTFGLSSFLPLRYSSDGRTLYFLSRDSAGTALRAVPAAGGPNRVVVRFDDPTRPWHRYGMAINGKRVFLTLGDLQSDIYVADLSPAR